MQKTLIKLIAATGMLLAGQSPLRDFPVDGAVEPVTVNMQTGTFKFIARGISPRVKYCLQFHIKGLSGAEVIGSDVANPEGQVDITGKLDTKQLQLLNQNSADFAIGLVVL